MNLVKGLLIGVMALVAIPASAEPVQWSSAETSLGTVTAEFPCSEEAVQVLERDGLEAIRCDSSGLVDFLFVLPAKMLSRFGFPGSSIEDLRKNIEADEATEYLIDTSISGFAGFYSEGRAGSGKVALGIVDIRDGRYVMLNVQSDGSDEAEKAISEVFVRSWGSLQVVKP